MFHQQNIPKILEDFRLYICKLGGQPLQSVAPMAPVDSIAAPMEVFHSGSLHHCPSNSVPNVPGRHKQLQLTGHMFTL